jgi:hypothetical protein
MYYLLQYTKALQSIELPKKPAALSHTNSVAVAANAQCNNNNNNKKQSSVRSESVFFSQRTRSPTGDSGGGQTNQRNAEQQQQRAFNRTSSLKTRTIPRTIPSPVLPRTECHILTFWTGGCIYNGNREREREREKENRTEEEESS